MIPRAFLSLRASYAEAMSGTPRLTPSSRRRLRYLAPVAVAAAIGLGAWIPTLPAGASPQLPTQTVNQLIARAEQPSVSGFTGSIEWSAKLGLPSLSDLTAGTGQSSSAFNWTDLLSGSHQVKVWDGGTNGQRLALIESASEVDIYRSSDATGGQTWLYDSTTNTATHLVAATHPGTGSTPAATSPDAAPALTPQQVAEQVLRQVENVTALSVSSATYVAGQPAYVLSLRPTPGSAGAAASTIGRITIAVDAANGAVLRVTVVPVGTTTPALSLGFTSVQFAKAGSQLPAAQFRVQPLEGHEGCYPDRRRRPAIRGERRSARFERPGADHGRLRMGDGGRCPRHRARPHGSRLLRTRTGRLHLARRRPPVAGRSGGHRHHGGFSAHAAEQGGAAIAAQLDAATTAVPGRSAPAGC